MTEKEAKLEAIERNKQFRYFCPLIKEECNHNCICFTRSESTNGGNYNPKGYYATTPTCGNF